MQASLVRSLAFCYKSSASNKLLWSSFYRGNQTSSRKSETPDSLRISDRCSKRLNEICSDGEFLRVAVEGGGCSGFRYTFELDKTVNQDDVVLEKDGVKVVVDNISLPLLSGSTVDYQEELIRASFRIVDNPNAGQGCSCGASFPLKET